MLLGAAHYLAETRNFAGIGRRPPACAAWPAPGRIPPARMVWLWSCSPVVVAIW